MTYIIIIALIIMLMTCVPTETLSDVTQVSAPQLVVGIEGSDTRISCNLTGIPLPTITWTIDNLPAPYPQTDLITDYHVTFLEGDSYQVDQGMALSSLLIANLQYSADDNTVLTCMGSNSHGDDSALIRLNVLGILLKISRS